MDKITFKTFTLGCKVNQYESLAITQELEKAGFYHTPNDLNLDLIIINTCTVTGEADRKCRQIIRRAKNENPHAYVIVTGCYAQASAVEIAKIPGVDVICGSRTKLDIIKHTQALFFGDAPDKLSVKSLDNCCFEPLFVSSSVDERTRAYVKICDGCQAVCTYCIIPSVRGNVSSKSIFDTVNEVKALLSNGYREIVLTAIEISQYGSDFTPQSKHGEALIDLLYAIDSLDEVANYPNLQMPRIRLGSLDPSLMKADFIEKIAGIRSLAPHFHLSLQSGCNRTLAAMKRTYNTKMIMDSVNLLRKKIPDVLFTCDIITGFPGESDEDFNITRQFLKTLKCVNSHVFSYSKRMGTPAATMPCQISSDVKKERTSILIDDAAKNTSSILNSIIESGKILYPLFEHGNGKFIGHTKNFIEIEVDSNIDLQGKILPVKGVKVKNGKIIAKLV